MGGMAARPTDGIDAVVVSVGPAVQTHNVAVAVTGIVAETVVASVAQLSAAFPEVVLFAHHAVLVGEGRDWSVLHVGDPGSTHVQGALDCGPLHHN